MSKKLIVVLALAFIVGITAAAFAEVQNVKVGGDLEVIGFNRNQLGLRSSNSSGAIQNTYTDGVASVARIKVEANLTDNVDVNFRLLNQRIWGTNGAVTADQPSQINIDNAYITLKDFLKETTGVPLTLKIGQQDVRLGSGLLVGDANTNRTALATSAFNTTGLGDLDRNKSFDAAIAIADFSPLTVIAGFAKGAEGALTTDTDDSDVYILQGAYDTGVSNTIAELTYVGVNANKNEVNNFGIRVTSKPITNLAAEAEYVYQTQKNQRALQTVNKERVSSDSALRLNANYTLADVTWTPAIGADYSRLSQDWNVMFEDQTPAILANLLFANTNTQTIGVTASAKPMEDLLLKLRYASFRSVGRLNVNGVTSLAGDTLAVTEKKALGSELDLGLTYDYTKDVQLGLDYGFFKPGQAFNASNRETASQVVGSMKVSF